MAHFPCGTYVVAPAAEIGIVRNIHADTVTFGESDLAHQRANPVLTRVSRLASEIACSAVGRVCLGVDTVSTAMCEVALARQLTSASHTHLAGLTRDSTAAAIRVVGEEVDATLVALFEPLRTLQ